MSDDTPRVLARIESKVDTLAERHNRMIGKNDAQHNVLTKSLNEHNDRVIGLLLGAEGNLRDHGRLWKALIFAVGAAIAAIGYLVEIHMVDH